MARSIESVAVLGGGTMGSGIAGACAQAGCRVLLLDVSREAAEQALDRIVNGRPPAVDDDEAAGRIALGSFDDLEKITDYDWICEAVIEDLDTKRALFARLEPLRRDGSVVSTNTSGIPLRAITEGMPERLRRDVTVTHFFNPVKVMKLMELVPGAETTPDVIDAFAEFCGKRLGKGVVHAKDTVNFIGNRIGCFWMLSGLHKARAALESGLSMEMVDAVMGAPAGLPSTGLYGLIDLIGLDVMDFVAKNLEKNLPADDPGRAYLALPPAEQEMLARGQLGRKTGGGFYKMIKHEDGSRSKETFDLLAGEWRPAEAATPTHADIRALFAADDAQGRFAWALMGGTLAYAADLVPEISDDIVNVDRAMRWGFAWKQGPFEMLDVLDPPAVITRLEQNHRPVPNMLALLRDAGVDRFYRDEGKEFLGTDGRYHAVPAD
ncbi:MAG: 3-hydroxyacyl-CoA dehydrogenase family protein [Rhodospirillales bacterium]|nr:MAG: 3-hydroxyacyl-CoA dehydrogenase family protein [Rhodospirillales bacterium]